MLVFLPKSWRGVTYVVLLTRAWPGVSRLVPFAPRVPCLGGGKAPKHRWPDLLVGESSYNRVSTGRHRPHRLGCHWRIGLAPRFFDLGRGELVFFRRFPFFFEQNPTLNRKKSFRCAKGRAFSFFSGRKKFFLSPKRASPTSSPYSPEVS